MAELRDRSSKAAREAGTGGAELTTERELRARIAELEVLLESRTQAIVGMGARLAEVEQGAPPAASERIRELERQLGELRATKVVRYSAVPRRLYGRVRRMLGGGA